MPRKVDYTVKETEAGKTVAALLRERGLSCRLVRSLKMTEGGILKNSAFTRSIDRVSVGDTVTVTFGDEENSVEPSTLEIDVVYEDDDVLIINKPAALAMHPTHNHQGDTLANAVQGHLEKEGKHCAFRTVGRLDKDTSGLVICALNKYTAAALQAKIEKTYFAVAQGSFEGSGTIDRPIVRPDPMKTLRAVGENGERAVTHYETLASANGFSLLKIRLETGRTHQIRVHFASLGAPLAGDDMYGGLREKIKRHALHCGEISFLHPVKKTRLSFSSPLPEDMKELVLTCGLHKDE